MGGLEVFLWLLALLGWVIFQIVQRVRRPPRPLGSIEDEPAPPPQEPVRRMPQPAPPQEPIRRMPQPQPPQEPIRRTPQPLREVPLDVEWGRTPVPTAPPLPRMPHPVPAVRSADRSLEERAISRELRRSAEARRQQPERPVRRHPYRPQLRTSRDLRAAVVLATVLGPCRAFEPYEPPDQRG